MNKQQLLELIQQMPDDLEVAPINICEGYEKSHEWEYQYRSTHLGAVYRKNVDNEITLTLRFKTIFEGEFSRKYENVTGNFSNLRRIK